MTDTELRAVIIQELSRIAPEADFTKVGDGDDLRDALDIDSMDVNRFILALHDRLRVDIAEREYPDFLTLGGCVRELAARLRVPGGG